MQTHRLFYLILVVATLAIASAQVGAYYYVERSNNGVTSGSSALCNYLTTGPSGASEIVVNTLINYGNGTIKWYNQTTVPSSWNAYALTMYVTKCDVQTRYYGPPLNEHFITGINGVNEHGSLSWSIWTFCSDQHAWSYSQVGVDLIHLTNGNVLAWVYGTSSSANTPPAPIPGEETVVSCV